MKKILALILAALMLLSLAACGSKDTTTPGGSEQPEDTTPTNAGTSVDMWRIGTASMTGNFYTIGSAIAQMVNNCMDGEEAAAQATGGSADNCWLLEDKEIELALIQSATAKQAIDAQDAFDGHPITMMRGIGVTQLNTFHCIVNKNSGVEEIKDLAGKKIGVGPMGGGVEVNANILLSEFGVTDFTPIYGTMGEALEQVQTGEVDCVIYATTIGSANVSDCLDSGKCKLLGMSAEKAAEICANRTEFGPASIPANTYKDQGEEIATFAGTCLILTRDDISEEEVYQFTKAFYENHDYLVSQNALFTEITPDIATVGMCVPFHPGAERYLKEQGIL